MKKMIAMTLAVLMMALCLTACSAKGPTLADVKAAGKLTYKKVSGSKRLSVNKKTGKVKIKKGLKKGTYEVKVKVKAAGNANYEASAVKTVTFKVKIK